MLAPPRLVPESRPEVFTDSNPAASIGEPPRPALPFGPESASRLRERQPRPGDARAPIALLNGVRALPEQEAQALRRSERDGLLRGDLEHAPPLGHGPMAKRHDHHATSPHQ